jgi:hypothetical protein
MEFLSDARQDVYKPSLFELIAQEQLRDLLQPALKYVLGVRDIRLFTVYCHASWIKISVVFYINILILMLLSIM